MLGAEGLSNQRPEVPALGTGPDPSQLWRCGPGAAYPLIALLEGEIAKHTGLPSPRDADDIDPDTESGRTDPGRGSGDLFHGVIIPIDQVRAAKGSACGLCAGGEPDKPSPLYEEWWEAKRDSFGRTMARRNLSEEFIGPFPRPDRASEQLSSARSVRTRCRHPGGSPETAEL